MERRLGWAMIAVLSLAAALRLYHLGYKSLWADEALTVFIAGEPLARIPMAVRGAEQTPPLYHFLMHFWTGATGLSEAAVRLPSVLFGVAAVWAIYALGTRLFDRRAGLIAALLLAVSGFQILYSQEARFYSLLLLMALVSSWMFIAVLDGGRLKYEIGYVLATSLLYWTHLHGVFVVAVQQITWCWSYRTGRTTVSWRRWIILTALPIVFFSPWIPSVIGWIRNVAGGFWIPPLGADYLPRTYALYAGSYVMLGLFIPLAGLGVASANESWKKVFLVGMLLLPVLIPYGLSLATRPLIVPRYAIASSAALFLLSARGITKLPGRRRWFIAATIVILTGLSVWSIQWARSHLEFKPDARGTTDYVFARAHRGDIVFIGGDYGNLVLRHYLRDAEVSGLFVTSFAEDLPTSIAAPNGATLWEIRPTTAPDRLQSDKDPAQRLAKLHWQRTKRTQFDGYVIEQAKGTAPLRLRHQ